MALLQRRLLIHVGLAISTLLIVSNVSAQIPEKTISVSTASQGGAWYGIAARVLREVEKANPELVTQVQPGGAIANVRRVNAGKTDLAFTLDFVSGLAHEGKPPFQAPLKDFVYLAKLFPGYTQIVTVKASNIRRFEDLFDKRITGGKNGWASELMFRLVLDVFGMNYDKIRERGGVINFIGTGQATQMMRDGTLDAMFITGNPTEHPKFKELSLTTDIDLLVIDDKSLDKVFKTYPFLSEIRMPEKPGYKGVKGGFRTIGGAVILVARKTLSNEAAYSIVKTYYDNLAEIKSDMRMLRENKFEDALKGISIPIHPGAAKYYKEKGLM